MISNPTIEAGPVTRHNQTDVGLVTGDECHAASRDTECDIIVTYCDPPGS